MLREIAKDDEERKRREHDEESKKEEEEQKLKDKMSMDDAARFIQRKWTWFQTVGRFQAKKRKGKKKKGKKKK